MKFFEGLWSSFELGYAETHYKFKLPWSLLYKKEPEIILDAPFQIIPGEPLKIYAIFRDAHLFPIYAKSLTATLICQGKRETISRDIGKTIDTPFTFLDFDLGNFPAGDYEIFAELNLNIRGKQKTIRRFNLKGLQKAPLRIKVLKEAPPKPEGYIAGETHAHTYFSADPVEFGASPKVLQGTAKAVGLDFVFCTDHSYDFAFGKDDYMKRTDANARYQALREEIAELPATPKIIAGEEISAGNSEGRNVHLLFPGNAFYVAGEGDCGRKWLDNKPTHSITQILSQTDLPCFAAHPKEAMSRIERFIFRRGNWKHSDLCINSANPIAGLEFWNGTRDADFESGRNFWISELERENFILPLGGNDAHGDLNEYTGVKIPLFALKRSRAHIFGNVRTVVYGNDPIQAFRQNNLYITDGPALWWNKTGKSVCFTAKSSSDFGKIKKLKMYAQKKYEKKEAGLSASFEKISPWEARISIDLSSLNYARAEVETDSGHFALTSACPAI
ncbi:MAG: hypothetical protein M0P13_10430 [Fibrobacteraceae bacterium]|nr:hypothetical protein [Fibrobacteraceae bacterium]